MYRRVIPCQVNNEYVKGDGVLVGAAGSGNDVAIRLSFGAMWHGMAKSVVWKDANGENPVLQMLTTNLLEDGETEVYLLPVPPEAKTVAGEITMTIRGALTDENGETSVTMSVTARFDVAESDWDEKAQESQDPTPSVAEQLQAQVEAVKGDIAGARDAANEAMESAAAALESARKAEESVGKTSYIGDNGNWYEWDAEAGAFKDSGISAQGPEGKEGPRGPAGPAGSGSGDMQKSTYDPTGKERDVFVYADEALKAAKDYTDQKLQEIPTPDVSGQIATHNQDEAAHPALRAALADKAPMYTYSAVDITAEAPTPSLGRLHLVYK